MGHLINNFTPLIRKKSSVTHFNIAALNAGTRRFAPGSPPGASFILVGNKTTTRFQKRSIAGLKGLRDRQEHIRQKGD